MIEVHGLTKRYGGALAVDGLSFTVRPGQVTGFLGPNGSGKSTTLRMILGLDAPTGGRATVNGRPYAALRHPLREVGALLDATAVHPARSARHHLLALAVSNGLGARRVREVLALTGLEPVARRRAGRFSLGMKQRLGVAAALLGDPGVLLLDEPVNGLDPEGVRWIRTLLRELAAEGRTVLLSSHLLSETALTADHLVVIGRGRLVADCSTAGFLAEHAPTDVLVRCARPAELAHLLRAGGAVQVREEPDGSLAVAGPEPAAIGELAAAHGIGVHELTVRQASLERAFMDATGGSVEYRARSGKRTA
ncbi:ABC transporter ATP-binding protein [Streptomyces sp. CBMA156]|uniref:ABC transporter ATP-binding protein n=1 Tax=Streptomyces sp. CBMA156 TaxID=1930280 RepID=UPI001661BC08|nr:ATP-binding cassette domain-containing protein [Streptomyces sp. CBMA156]MBD0674795.1 multidrug ABC transporter ATP-binding protein [Streptomyces sp. CBMA156]